jgi:hypothetical protein
MIYARLNTDNTLVCVPTVQAPDYTLPGDDPTEHGWTEHATETAAYAHYGLIPEGTISADAEERLAQLQATIGAMTETLAQISPEKLAAVTARLDKLAPVRSEHDVPADPTYLPPATDLRTPR